MAAWSLIRQRWPTLLLLLALPLVKWGLPPGWTRLALFSLGGAALAGFAMRREGDWPRVRPYLARPWAGMAGGVYGFAMLSMVALLLLYIPFIQPVLPYALYDLAALFDPLPVYVGFKRGDAWPAGSTVLVAGAGAVAEEWIFRIALLARWLTPAELTQPLHAAPGLRRLPPLSALAKIGAVSAYFAALHWPQPPGALLVALLGSLALGGVLVWKRNFALLATLHLLFNWRALL